MTALLLLAFVWLVQDLLQVLVMGFFLVPDLFLMGVLAGVALFPPRGTGGAARIWTAFAGGLLWDLRWTALPGLTAFTDAGAAAFAIWLWGRTPPAGRSSLLFAVMAGGTHLFAGVLRFLIVGVHTPAALRMALVQQLTALPLVVLLALCVAWRGGGGDA